MGNTAFGQGKTNYYQDERPLPALANKQQQKKPSQQQNQGVNAHNYDDDSFYDSDFELYESDEEGDEGHRLTTRANDNELKDVMSLYKEKLISGGGGNNNMKYSQPDLEGMGTVGNRNFMYAKLWINQAVHNSINL